MCRGQSRNTGSGVCVGQVHSADFGGKNVSQIHEQRNEGSGLLVCYIRHLIYDILTRYNCRLIPPSEKKKKKKKGEGQGPKELKILMKKGF
mgnify:CR=1 FL=1